MLNNGFIDNWDDSVAFDNPDIEGLSVDNVKSWFSKGYVGMFQPLTISTYVINYNLGQFDPWGYHLFNLILYILIALLIWRLLFSLTSNYLAAIVVTTFIVVHPFSVESVAWAAP